ncbi:hypothetical protein [Cerasicoccus frondis]|uniref:hypothetical protein n=1 Tax=Cerasicoccus frondis TaxID=490090 RepID=UPI0028528308|nr:hypothetical protein [Cerasicoccus frondis]
MFPFQSLRVLAITSILVPWIAVSLQAQAADEPQPEEVILVGPGYITKGYKMIVNGQVVQTTDGRTYDTPDTNPQPGTQPPPPAQPPLAPQGNWPEVVTVINGQIVDPDTQTPVNNLPPEIELIPLGLRKITTPVTREDGQSGHTETTVPFFRVKVKSPEALPAPPNNTHPASMEPEAGPDFSGLLAAQEETDTAESEEADKDEGGGLFDFLFKKTEADEEAKSDELVIDLNKPLTQAEMEALQQSPEFQQYLSKQSKSNTRNFYSSKSRGRSVSTPKPPQKVVIENFNPEDWVEEAPVNPTPNMAIGKLVSVDLNREIAVCWLQTRYIRANLPMVTRNHELETTSVLMPSGQQDGRAAGFWIAEGKPNPGDEVIVPGPDYQGLIEPWVDVLTTKQ